jgi:hypothetical protein
MGNQKHSTRAQLPGVWSGNPSREPWTHTDPQRLGGKPCLATWLLNHGFPLLGPGSCAAQEAAITNCLPLFLRQSPSKLLKEQTLPDGQTKVSETMKVICNDPVGSQLPQCFWGQGQPAQVMVSGLCKHPPHAQTQVLLTLIDPESPSSIVPFLGQGN